MRIGELASETGVDVRVALRIDTEKRKDPMISQRVKKNKTLLLKTLDGRAQFST
jgi:hypothetical protein